MGLEKANSTEFDADTPHPVVIFMPEVMAWHAVFCKYDTFCIIGHEPSFILLPACRGPEHIWEAP